MNKDEEKFPSTISMFFALYAKYFQPVFLP